MMKYEVVWIACKNLSVIWSESQRPFKPSRAKEIADNFDPDLLDPLKVTKPNGAGIYHICDGQTRKAAIEMKWGSEEKVPCHVSTEGDPVRAAQIFLRTNTSRRPPTAVDNFKVSVTARQPNEVAVDRIVRHHHFRVDSHGVPNAISAVGALLHVFTVCSPKVLDKTLQALRDIWADDHNAVVGPILRGFGAFLNEFGDKIDYPKFIETTKKTWTPGTLLRDMKVEREVRRMKSDHAVVQLLVKHYNKTRGVTPLKRKEPTAK